MVIIRLPAVDRSLHGYPDAREEVDGLSTLTSFNTVSIIHQSFFFLLFFWPAVDGDDLVAAGPSEERVSWHVPVGGGGNKEKVISMPVWNTCRSSATDVPVLSLCLMLIDFRFLRSSSGFQSTFSDGPQPKKEIAVYHFPYCAISSTYGTTISIDSLVLGGRRRNRFSSSHRRWCHVSFLIFVFPFSGPSFLSRNSKIKRKSATSTSWIFTTRSTTL